MGEEDEALIHAGYTWSALSLHAEATFIQGKNIAKLLQKFLKTIIGTHLKALAKCNQMNTTISGFQ